MAGHEPWAGVFLMIPLDFSSACLQCALPLRSGILCSSCVTRLSSVGVAFGMVALCTHSFAQASVPGDVCAWRDF